MVLPQGQAGGVNGAEGIFVYAGQLEPASGQNHFSLRILPQYLMVMGKKLVAA
jgi:hypothetical protein